MSGALIPSAIASQGRPSRLKRQPLLSSCAVAAALVVAGHATPVRAQAFQGNPTTVSGTVSFNRATPGFDLITVDSPTAIVNWTTNDTAIGGGAINYLPAGMTARYTSTSGSDFTILNRILPTDATRPVAFNGTVLSNFTSPTSGITTALGNVWFYSPGGIIAGASAIFDVGSLVLTGADIDTTGGLFGPGNTIRFRGATDSRSAVDIQAGAQITASREGSYVALVAPRVSQAGTVNVNGSAAYVAAEAVDISINAGLFDFTVITGSNVNAGGETTLSHTGTTTGPSPLDGTDPHAIYMVNMPKNDAVTMLLTGSAGFAAASTAGVENGVVVLSAGLNVTTASNGTGGVDINAIPGPSNDQNAFLNINNAIVTSRVAGVAITDATATTGSSGTLALASGVNLAAGRNVTLRSDGGGTVAVGGDVQLTTFNQAANGSALAGTVAVRAVAGAMTIGGNVALSADNNASLGNATAGTAAIEANGATLAIGGSAQLLASATGGSDAATGGDGQGGNATVSVNSGTLNIGGNLILAAQGQGGIGSVQGGVGRGGTTSISIVNGNLSAAGFAIMTSRGLGGNGPTGGNGVGGTASFLADDGSLLLGTASEPDFFQILAGGIGGTADDGGTAGNGTGGSATFNSVDTTPDATPSTITMSTFTIAAGGNGGSFTGSGQAGGNGGIGTGGGVALTIGAGDVRATNVTLLGDGTGSNGNNAVDSVNGGNGGNATGGGANLSVTGGSLTVQSLNMTANAIAGSGGDVFESGYGTPGGAGGAGGIGIAGNITASFSGGTASGTNLSLEATGFGGAGGSSSGTPGTAGLGRGATAQVRVVGGQITFDTVDVVADGDGGDGGDSANQTVGSTGGAAEAGTARFLISSGSATINSLLSLGGGEGGEAGRGGFGADFVQAAGAGTSNGGTSELLVSGGTLTAAQTEISATAVGVGDSSQLPGGTVRGGNALLDISGGSASFTSTVFVNASAGLPGEPQAAGAPTFGGSATVSLSNGTTATFASGLDVRADAANGPAFNDAVAGVRGGTVSVTVDGTLNLGTNSLFLSANGFGTPSSLIGGSGTGGSASLTINGGSIIADSASILADGSGGSGFSSSGSGPDAGAGGSGTGGSASFTMNGGSFLPTSLTISATGNGGAGGPASDGPNGGGGGAGQGGNVLLTMTGGTLGDANLSSISMLGFGFGGEGGDALETGYGASGNGGSGGSSTGGSASISITGGTLVATSFQADPWSRAGEGGSSVSGNGGNGGNGSGGSSFFVVNGPAASLTIDSLSLFGDGNGALGGTSTSGTAGIGGDGDGGLARLDIRDGTVNIGSLFLETGSFNGAPANASGGGSELLISGGTVTIGSANISSDVYVNSNQQLPGAQLRGGTSQVVITGGTVTFTSSLFLEASAIFENDGVPFTGGNALGGDANFEATSAASVTYPGTIGMFADARGGTGSTGGSATGGQVTLAVADGSLGILNASALAVGGAGTVRGGDATAGNVTVSSTDGVFNLASINVNLTATGGLGLNGSASGSAGGDGGNAQGGSVELNAQGSGAELNISNGDGNFLATAGNGGNGASGTTGGAGGKGANATGATFEIVADLGTVNINNVDGNGPFLDLSAIAGVGGNGGDGSDVGNTGGIGGDGGSATGGTALLSVFGGAVNLGATGVRANGTGATGGAGGIGAGTPGDPLAVPPVPPGPTTQNASGADGTGRGGLVAIEINDDSGGQAGSATLGATQFDVQGYSFNGEFGDQVGRVELYDNGAATGGGLTLASLNIFDGGTVNTSDQAVDFFAASRRITITGDAGIQTPAFVYFRATGTGGVDIGGSLGVTSGGSIIVDHTGQPATPAPTVHANDMVFIANGGPFQGSASSLITANQNVSIQANGGVSLGDVVAGGNVNIDATGAIDAASLTAGTGGAFSIIKVFTPGTVDIGTLAADTGDIDVEGDSGVAVGTGSAGHALTLSSENGGVAAGDLTAGGVGFGGFEEFDGIGIKALAGITTGALSSQTDVGMVTLGSMTIASIDAGRDVVLLPAGSLTVGPVTAGNRFYVANASMLSVIEPDPDVTPVDLTALDGVDLDPIGGSATIGDVDAGIIRMAIAGSVTTGHLAAHAPAGTTRFSAIELLAGGGATLGDVTADFGDIDIEVDGALSSGAMSAGDSIRLLGGGAIVTGDLTGGTFDGTGVTGYLGSVGAATTGSITVGDVIARNDIGFATGSSLVAGNLTAGRDAGVLAVNDITVGTVTNPGAFYISNASILGTLGITEPALEDIPTILAATPVAINGDLTIGTLISGNVLAPVGGDISIGTLISTDAIVFNAANNFTVGTAVSGDSITIDANGDISIGTADAADLIDIGGTGNLTAGALLAGNGITVDVGGDADIGQALAGNRTLAGGMFIVDANLNSEGGGTPLASIDVVAGDQIVVASSTDDLWSAGALPRFSDGNGLVATRFATATDDSGQPVGTQIGANFGPLTRSGFSAPFGALVGRVGGQPVLLGANGTVTAPATGTLQLSYWDDNSADNTGNISFAVMTPSALASGPGFISVNAGGDAKVGFAQAGTSIDISGGTVSVASAMSGGTINLLSTGSINAGGLIALGDIFADGQSLAVDMAQSDGSIVLSAAPGGNARFGIPDATRTITAGSLDAGGNLDVNALGAIDIGTANAGGRLLVVSPTTIDLDSATVTGDALIDASARITVGSIIGARDVELVTDIRSGDTDLTLPRSITVDSAEAGDDLVVAAFGSVTAGSLTSNGTGQDGTNGLHGSYANRTGSSVLLISEKGAQVTSIDAADNFDANNIAEVRNGVQISDGSGGITVDTLTAGGSATLASAASPVTVNDVQVAGTVSAQSTDVTLTSLGGLNLRNVAASGTAAIRAAGLLTINGSVSGATINLASSDIAISATSLVGNSGTQTLSLANRSGGTAIVGGGDVDGWTLSNAEFGRLQAHDIRIFSSEPETPSQNLVLRDLTINGSAFVSQGGTTARANLTGSTLTLNASGVLRVEGNVALGSAGADDVLELTAADRIEVITPSGSISLADANGGLAGTLRMNAQTVFVGSSAAFGDIFPDSTIQPTISEIDARLAINDGEPNSAGYLQAGAMSFGNAARPVSALYIQNSGGSTEPGAADRAGFTVGGGGISILTAGSDSRIVINGRQATSDTANPFVTGRDVIPVISFSSSSEGGGFDQGSTVNGCLIVSTACGFDLSEPMTEATNTPATVLEEVVEKAEEEADDGTQVIQQLNLPLIRFVDFSGLGFTPVIDEPVTGTGNDDLWMGGPSGGQ